MTTRLRAFSMAVGRMEGYYVTEAEAKARHIPFPTLPQKLFNPGDLIYVGQHKATPFSVTGPDGKTRVYCKFANEADGFDACDFQLTLYARRGCTVQQTINKWAPADDGNNPGSYTAGICKLMNCHPTDLLSAVISAPALHHDEDCGHDSGPAHYPHGVEHVIERNIRNADLVQ